MTSTFLAFAVLAFFVCMYLGAEAMLGWLPADWGRVDEDGEFQPFVGTLAVLFMLFAGGQLVIVLDKSTRHAVHLRKLEDVTPRWPADGINKR